jgi:hypothetical protein
VYEVIAFMGTGERQEDRRTIRKRLGRQELITTTKKAPHPQSAIRPDIDVNITWLLNHFNPASNMPNFEIDRERTDCHTPRRNKDVDAAIKYHQDIGLWCKQVCNYFGRVLGKIVTNRDRDLLEIAMNTDSVFVPVVPLLIDNRMNENDSTTNTLECNGNASTEEKKTDESVVTNQTASCTRTIPINDLNLFLKEEYQSLHSKCSDIGKSFPDGITSTAVISSSEGELLVTLGHLEHICQSYVDGVQYIEDIVRKQLVAAIGREISPSDLYDYMRFHNNKIFKDMYALLPFCYAVRRSESHGPEGVLSIEVKSRNNVGGKNNIPTPIYTVASREVFENNPETNMEFSLGASTKVSFSGDRHLHAWLQHTFSGSNDMELSLVAEARQFSSYIVLVGRISSAREFDPTFGIIVKDKDSVRIPLNLEQIPSAKEFKNAIQSLSPEQQAFAQAFRSMQLESTLFGVCVIQIKPQLEKVLNLAPNSLTKEIKLNQDLMELFIDYQIPSDLLSFSGDDASDGNTRLNAVKGHVSAMQVIGVLWNVNMLFFLY